MRLPAQNLVQCRTPSIGGFAVAISIVCAAEPLWSQQLATTVQLPTFSYFSVNTSVSVPDSGGPYRDLLRRSQWGQTRPYSPLDPRLLAKHPTATSGLSHTAPARDHGYSSDEIGPVGNLIVRRNGPARADEDDQDLSSRLAQARQDRTRAARERDSSIRQAIAQGREAVARGRLGSARVLFSAAARQAQGALRDEALAELEALETPQVAKRPGAK